MKYNIDNIVYFKQHFGNDEFVIKGTIIGYCEQMTYYPTQQLQHQGLSQQLYISSGISGGLGASNSGQKVPGYQILVQHPHQQVFYIPEFNITSVMKKEAFKSEMKKLTDI